MKLKENIIGNILNLQGFKTNRKIIVFESDDWGSIRMPSVKAYQNLLRKGIRVDRSNYDRLDALENKSDLTNLLELLAKHKPRKQHPVTFTLNTVLTNPDFEKIRRGNYKAYHYELFFNSYHRYYGEDLKSLWMEGISDELIKPQFHAREHLNTNLWMQDLQSGNPKTRMAFDEGFFGIKTKTSSPFQNHYLAAYWAENPHDLSEKALLCRDGLDLFRSAFGFHSKSFIACNYIWPVALEPELHGFDIRYLQGQRAQIAPAAIGGKCKPIYHTTGQRNQFGQIYLVRNCWFEPYENPKKDWVDSCLSEISNAFFWKTPALISTHRINYAGTMDVRHRDHNLKQLDVLLQKILKKWPQVEFMSSDALGALIEKR